MDVFLANAAEILRAATTARRLSPECEDVAIFVEDDGQIHIVAGTGGSLPSMAQHYGARTAYQVRHAAGGVSVEGRSGERWCRIGQQTCPVRWLGNFPRYQLTPAEH